MAMPPHNAPRAKRLSALFQHYVKELRQIPELDDSATDIRLRLLHSSNDGFIACITIEEHRLIEISSLFLVNIFHELRSLLPTIRNIIFNGFAHTSAHPGTDAVLAVFETCVSFLLMHEISHNICGHLDHYISDVTTTTSQHKIGRINMSSYAETANPVDGLLRRYFYEGEADCSAIQAIMQSDTTPRVRRLLDGYIKGHGAKGYGPAFLTGKSRVIGFRIIAFSVLYILNKIEVIRGPNLPSPHHPLPGARIIMALSTLIEQYCEFVDAEPNSEGQIKLRLTTKQAAVMRQCFNIVLAPVISISALSNAFNTTETKPGVNLLTLAKEFGNSILINQPTTEYGKQVLLLEQIRHKMNTALAPHRKYH